MKKYIFMIFLILCILECGVLLQGCDKTLTLAYVEEVAATTECNGIKEYWVDLSTGEMYADCYGRNKIKTPEQIARLEHETTSDYYYNQDFHWKYITNDDSIETINKESHVFIDGVCSQCGYSQDLPNWESTELIEKRVYNNLKLNYLNEAKIKRLNDLIAKRDLSLSDFYGDVIEISGKVVDTIKIDSENKTTLILDNVEYNNESSFIEVLSDNDVFIIVPNATKTTVQSVQKSIVSKGTIYIYGLGELSIDTESVAIEAKSIVVNGTKMDITSKDDGLKANIVELYKSEYYCNTYGDGIESSEYIYALDCKINLKSFGAYIEYCEENMDFYGLSDSDFIFKKVSDKYGCTRDKGILQYALQKSCKGLFVAGDEEAFKQEQMHTILKGIYLYDCNIESDTIDDSIGVRFGNIVIRKGEHNLKSKTNTYRADGIFFEAEATININSAYEAVEAGLVEIGSGTITANTVDDCIESYTYYGKEGSTIIKGGIIFCQSALDDGFDVYRTLLVLGGDITAIGSNYGEGFDVDGEIVISAGEIYTEARYGVATYSNLSEQNVIVFNCSTSIATNKTIIIKKDDMILKQTSTQINAGVVVISSLNIQANDVISIYIDDELRCQIDITKNINVVNI